MPIEKGQDWGYEGTLGPTAPVVGTDRDAARLVTQASPHDLPVKLGVSAGDLARTLGVRESFDPYEGNCLVPVDVLRVELEDRSEHVAAAHVIVGHPLVDRHVVVVMNAAFIGKRNVAPRSHPGDGKADVVTFRLGPTDRFKALQRMVTGSHLPHPDITLRQRGSGTVEMARPRPVWIDGRRAGRSRTLEFAVLADAMIVAV